MGLEPCTCLPVAVPGVKISCLTYSIIVVLTVQPSLQAVVTCVSLSQCDTDDKCRGRNDKGNDEVD